ncbi:5-oxoprolinase subunit B family protein [Kibdelosporangium phytohabitans]|uniref:Allophanate hydrolase n=1 Tax=Kibdelosporangium phytohabitans TaxID=860235 RepID=A0A0N9ICL0_9PSEU|nr:allophanate hydrolase subunit 1 [Kibdelosporangium phytohabitans]ALG14178.1 allophanate hydrolase [Kibdelosporangium phytohabitans]MBE1466831.1 KipI family sensor histidine kinase inhibitor [Kibdelosporangium phytohabitans]
MRLRRCGADAMLVEVDSLDEVDAVRAALADADLPGLVELVPAARTVLAAFRPGSGGVARLQPLLSTIDLSVRAVYQPREVVLPVRYDGPDLELVAQTAGTDVASVIDLHTSAEYKVAFCGFAPGFGYMTGLPEALRQPRLDNPRKRVPRGSVAIAGEFTGAYPTPSPGGWRLLGHTDATLFDPEREPAALLAPGDSVRFEAIR